MDTLWPDLASEPATNNLRVAMHRAWLEDSPMRLYVRVGVYRQALAQDDALTAHPLVNLGAVADEQGLTRQAAELLEEVLLALADEGSSPSA